MPPSPLSQLLNAVRQFVARELPGRTPKRLSIHLHEDAEPVSLPIPGPAAPADAPAEADAPATSKCAIDIILTLQEVGHRLTTTRLLTELSRRDREWSERSVATWLARLVEEGTLTKDPRAKPPGYGLPEWGNSPPGAEE